MSELRGKWLFVNAIGAVVVLYLIGVGWFNVGVHTPSDQLVYSLSAPVILSWLLYFGSRS